MLLTDYTSLVLIKPGQTGRVEDQCEEEEEVTQRFRSS